MIPPIGCRRELAKQGVSDGIGNGGRPGDTDASGPGRCREGNGFGIVIGRRDDDEFVEAPGNRSGIGAGRGPGIGQENRDFAGCPRPFELGGGGPQAEGEIGRAMAAQSEKVGDDTFGGSPRTLTGENKGVIAERDHACVDGCPPKTRGGGNSGGRQSIATHRAAAIDDETQGQLRFRPLARHQFIKGGRISPSTGRSDGFEAAVDIELASGEVCATVTEPADPRPARRAGPHDINHDATGELPGQRPQSLVGSPAQLGEQCERVIGVVAQSIIEGRFVELSDIGRDLLEPGIPSERLPRRCATRRLGERILSFLPLKRAVIIRFGAAPTGAGLRAQAFPGLALELGGAVSALAGSSPAGSPGSSG
jgi:hypothetical protein